MSVEMQTHVACRGDTLDVRCSRSRRVAVQWASYGYSHRHADNNSCQSGTAYDTGQFHDELEPMLSSGGSTLGPRGAQPPPPPKSWLDPKFSRTLDTLWSIDSQKN